MKKTIFLLSVFFISLAASAQLKFNPQAGMTFSSFSNPPEGFDFKAKAGFMAGGDLRIGKRVQFQPGAFYVNSATATENTEGEVSTDDIIHRYVKIKALIGFDIIESDILKLRINAGPTYDLLLAAKYGDEGIKQNWKDGTFFIQGGVGVDILFLTAELGYAQGITQTFVDEYTKDSKTSGFYFTIGVVF